MQPYVTVEGAYVAAQVACLDESRDLLEGLDAPLVAAEVALAEGDLDQALGLLATVPADDDVSRAFVSMLAFSMRMT